MKIVQRITVTCLCAVALAGIAGGAASARTPTPTATSTPAPPPTAPPVPPPPAVFGGTAWVDGQISSGPVVAKIGGAVCGNASILGIPGAGFSYQVEVASEEASPGCGVDGATITFFVAGKQAAQTAMWHSGSFQPLALITGPFFSTFEGVCTINRFLTSEKLVAFVGSTACGDFNRWTGAEPHYVYHIKVFSSQLTGCGTEGAEVTFKIVDAQGSVIAVANEKGVWHVWDEELEPSQLLNLTFSTGSGITMPGTGAGDGADEESLWSSLAVLLVLVGLGSAAIGLVFRRQAMTR